MCFILGPSTSQNNKVGRPYKLFSDLHERSKRRRLNELENTVSPEEASHLTRSFLRKQGRHAAADLVRVAVKGSPTKPLKIRRIYRESLKTSNVSYLVI